MASLMSHHVRRQVVVNDPSNPDYCPWWYCDQTAYIVKWIVVGVIFFLLLAFIIGGHWHAKRRMARGQAPLRYHRWLISRQARERFFPQQQYHNAYGFGRPTYVPGGNGQPQSFPMHNYAYTAPPPAYHEAEAVPVYTPPSKVNPDQSYAPPSGPPPPSAYNPEAGSSNLRAPTLSQPPRIASPHGNDR